MVCFAGLWLAPILLSQLLWPKLNQLDASSRAYFKAFSWIHVTQKCSLLLCQKEKFKKLLASHCFWATAWWTPNGMAKRDVSGAGTRQRRAVELGRSWQLPPARPEPPQNSPKMKLEDALVTHMAHQHWGLLLRYVQRSAYKIRRRLCRESNHILCFPV